MTQSKVFTHGNGSKVCNLQRCIYGLKQASRSHNIRFNETIKEFGFSRNADETCMYKEVSGSVVIFLELYVDDILFIGNNVSKLQFVNIYRLSKFFPIKTLEKQPNHWDIDV